MKSYKIKEIHYTIQGEGANAGTPMVLIRFAGCNAWSGRDEDREKASAKAMCAMWCDTDFRGTDGNDGGTYTAQELLEKVYEITSWDKRWAIGAFSRGLLDSDLRTVKGVVLFTGGEPMLQVDEELVGLFLNERIDVAIETNGSQDISAIKRVSTNGVIGKLWITVSPKPPLALHASINEYGIDELKLVYDPDQVVPHDYSSVKAQHLFLQPLDDGDPESTDLQELVFDYVRKDPRWRVSTQTHKIWRLP